jgi:hypothetical protein
MNQRKAQGMRSTIKTTVGVLLVVFAFAAVASASASAAPSVTLGSGKTAEFTEHAEILGRFEITAQQEYSVECSKLTVIKGALTTGAATFPIKALKLEGCVSLYEPTRCEVVGGVIESKELTAEVINGTTSPDTKVVIKPKSGKELFNKFKIAPKGEESCGFVHSDVVLKGSITSTEQNDSALATKQSLAFNISESNGELEWAEKAVSFKGKANLALTSGGTFAFTF